MTVRPDTMHRFYIERVKDSVRRECGKGRGELSFTASIVDTASSIFQVLTPPISDFSSKYVVARRVGGKFVDQIGNSVAVKSFERKISPSVNW